MSKASARVSLTAAPSNRWDITTVHGLSRTMERAGKTGQQALRMIACAWARGKAPDELRHAELRRRVEFFERATQDGRDGHILLRVYNRYLFIFSAEGRLITMFALPDALFKKRVYDGKARVRHVRKFLRMNRGNGRGDDFEVGA